MPPSMAMMANYVSETEKSFCIGIVRKAEPLLMPPYFDGKGNTLPRRKIPMYHYSSKMEKISFGKVEYL